MRRRLPIPMRRRLPGHGAFTLIELLVVIAIVAILAALLFPVFSAARERSRVAVCSSNLKQIGAAIDLYLQEWDEVYFPKGYRVKGGFWYWQQGVRPYLHDYNQGLWFCPSDQFTALSREENRKDDLAFKYSSYDAHTQFFGNYQCGQSGHAASAIKDPATTILIEEVPGGDFPRDGSRWLPRSSWEPDSEHYWRQIGRRHSGRQNYLFADGSVRFLTLRRTLTPKPLWENLAHWCPECPCADGMNWTQKDVDYDLAMLDRNGFP